MTIEQMIQLATQGGFAALAWYLLIKLGGKLDDIKTVLIEVKVYLQQTNASEGRSQDTETPPVRHASGGTRGVS